MTLEEPQEPEARERFLALDRMYEEANTDGEAFDGLLRAGNISDFSAENLSLEGFGSPLLMALPISPYPDTNGTSSGWKRVDPRGW
jgi:hypothetical protein